ncbi:50S ribosomal protein L2 [Patescibacteria group bacterium]|nr:50S ribosomal protein L2 [Patescibacteria group bacterium]MBU4162464.1 50S ribosomal protein L2 [Patescibacteria group bacterium]
MIMKKYKPTTPGRRHATIEDFSNLDKKRPEKSLVIKLKKKAGRNSQGKITVRHKGGGAKRLYRIIDFARKRLDIPAKVLALEYDPNRTAFIALIEYSDGVKKYILAPQGLNKGDTVITSENAELKPGNRTKLKNIPIGTDIYNAELLPEGGGKLIRSAGSSAKVFGSEEKYIHIKMPSGEMRKLHQECFASIGALSRPEHRYVKIGNAGRARHMGRRPTVRGSAMNPHDHPHGGGEGRTGIGLKYPKTPWGKPALGKKTRKRKNTNIFIIKRRK